MTDIKIICPICKEENSIFNAHEGRTEWGCMQECVECRKFRFFLDDEDAFKDAFESALKNI